MYLHLYTRYRYFYANTSPCIQVRHFINFQFPPLVAHKHQQYPFWNLLDPRHLKIFFIPIEIIYVICQHILWYCVHCPALNLTSLLATKIFRTPYPLHAPAPARGGATRDFIYMQQTRRKCGNIKIVLKNLLKISIFKDIVI